MEKKKTSSASLLAWWKLHRLRIIIFALITLFFLIQFSSRIFIGILPGQSGVLWSRFSGTIHDEGYDEGLAIISPLNRMYHYNLRIQKIEGEVVLLTSRGMSLDVEYTARFFLRKDLLSQLHQNIGPDYMEKIVRPEVVSAMRRVIGNYSASEIYAKDEISLLKELSDQAHVAINEHYVNFEDLLVTKLTLPETVQGAINEKLAHEQRVERERLEFQRREIESKGLAVFEKEAKVSILKWHGIEVTRDLANSPNAKFIVIGSDANSLPIILNTEDARNN